MIEEVFIFKDKKIILSESNKMIPEFRVILEGDNSQSELLYVYHMAHLSSPYNNIEEEKRGKKIIEDFFQDKKWKADIRIEKAIEKYELLTFTPIMRMVKSSRIGCDKLANFLETSNPEHKQYISNLTKISSIVENIDKLEERYKKEKQSNIKYKGGQAPSRFEE